MCPTAATLDAPAHQAPPRTVARPPGCAPEVASEPRSADGLRVSEETYWKEYYLESDIHYEWNNGRLEEKPVSDYGTFLVYAWFIKLLQHFLDTRPIARMVALEMGFRLALPTGTVIRKPDFGVVCNTNPQPLLPLDASYHGVFDLCIEALSDLEHRGSERDTVTKKAEYAAGGCPNTTFCTGSPSVRRFSPARPRVSMSPSCRPMASSARGSCRAAIPARRPRHTARAQGDGPRPGLCRLRAPRVAGGRTARRGADAGQAGCRAACAGAGAGAPRGRARIGAAAGAARGARFETLRVLGRPA